MLVSLVVSKLFIKSGRGKTMLEFLSVSYNWVSLSAQRMTSVYTRPNFLNVSYGIRN